MLSMLSTVTISLHTEDNMDSMLLPTEECDTDTIRMVDLVVDIMDLTAILNTITALDGIPTALGWSLILRVITEVGHSEPTNITDVHRLSRVLVDCPITGME